VVAVPLLVDGQIAQAKVRRKVHTLAAGVKDTLPDLGRGVVGRAEKSDIGAV